MKMRYKPSRDIPQFARELKTTSPSKIVEMILNRRNEERTPESVTMWFKQYPEIYGQLKKEFREGLPTATEQVDLSIYQNGQFSELPSVKNWMLELSARELTDDYVKAKINILKQICLGKILGFDLVQEGKWCLKHPDRLSLRDVMELIALLKARGKDTYSIKRDMKDFLQSKDVVVGKKFVVGKPKGYGKYKKLYVKPEVQEQMLEWIKSQNYEAYVVDRFMHKTGTRITASLNSNVEELRGNTLTVFDKGRLSKYPKGHPWDKRLPPKLLAEIESIIGDRKNGKIFSIAEKTMANLNKMAIEKFAPEILELYPDLMPSHFWRHIFFQNILRASDWNYKVAGALGGSSSQSVEESYGEPDKATVDEWREKYISD
jgi:hypothetical protein